MRGYRSHELFHKTPRLGIHREMMCQQPGRLRGVDHAAPPQGKVVADLPHRFIQTDETAAVAPVDGVAMGVGLPQARRGVAAGPRPVSGQAAEADPRDDPAGFARKVKERFVDGKKRH